MAKRDSAPVGAPCWVDILSSDTDKTRAFYGELFGWTSEEPDPDLGGYFNFFKDGVHIAGGMVNDGSSGSPDFWSVYLAVADAQATVDSAAAAGAEVVVPAMDVMDLGTMAVFTDPAQAMIGIWQPGVHKGFGFVGEPGAPSWFELHTRDYDTEIAFYRDAFGWDIHTAADEPGFRYSTLGEGENQLAGIMDASIFPPDAPLGWTIYFGTENADKTLAQVEKLGGAIVLPAEDTPYGRLAQASDPTGALFKLIQDL